MSHKDKRPGGHAEASKESPNTPESSPFRLACEEAIRRAAKKGRPLPDALVALVRGQK
jgi:hypothetical protein